MASKAVYKLMGIDAAGAFHEKSVRGAPADGYIAKWCKFRKLAFVTRYFPSLKGWVMWDTRKLDIIPHTSKQGNDYPKIVGLVRLKTLYPSEDAVVMKLYHMRNPPKQETLNL